MTDFQIIHNCILPQAAINERMERERKGLPPEADPDEEVLASESRVPDKRFMMSVLMGLGMTPKQAEEEYERQKKMNEKVK
jgi:hypothetical protein